MKTRAQIGVELEVAVRRGYRAKLVEYLREQNFMIGHSHYGYSRWCVKTDPSVVSDKFDNFTQTELTSPVMCMTRARKEIGRMLKILSAYPDYIDTNHSTGVHVNVSVVGTHSVHDINPIDVIMMCDELKTLRRWHREHNEYCEPYLPDVVDALEEYHNQGCPGDVRDFVRQQIHGDKYNSVNFCHYGKKDSWIEYRMLGDDYLRRVPEVMWEIDRLAAVTVQCATGEARQRARRRLQYQYRKHFA